MHNRLYIGLKAAFRIFICTLNNFYCIPVHMCWVLLLQPIKWASEVTYWFLEGIMFRWLLSMVALWSYSAGYNVVEVGDDVSMMLAWLPWVLVSCAAGHKCQIKDGCSYLVLKSVTPLIRLYQFSYLWCLIGNIAHVLIQSDWIQ